MRGSIPKADELYKVAKVLNISLEHLLAGHDTEKALVIAESAPIYLIAREMIEHPDLQEMMEMLEEIWKTGDKRSIETIKDILTKYGPEHKKKEDRLEST